MNAFGLNDEVVDFIIDKAKEFGLTKVVLFGSRATGRFSEKSDIDLAIVGGSLDDFVYSMDEECPTLLDFDFIDMGQEISDGLRDRIAGEGVVLYEVCQL